MSENGKDGAPARPHSRRFNVKFYRRAPTSPRSETLLTTLISSAPSHCTCTRKEPSDARKLLRAVCPRQREYRGDRGREQDGRTANWGAIQGLVSLQCLSDFPTPPAPQQNPAPS